MKESTVWLENNPPSNWEECGCCGGFHPRNYTGDCRDDLNRWPFNAEAMKRYTEENT